MAIKDIVIGEKLENAYFVLKSLHLKDGEYIATFADKTGETEGRIREELVTDDIKSSVKGAVKITAIAKPGKELAPLLQVKKIAYAKPGEYKSSELFDGLSEEKISEYKEIIRMCQSYVHHDGYKKLLAIVLTEENLNKLSVMPATLNYYGIYKGGALAGAALISRMVLDTGTDYVKYCNGLHQQNIDWSLLLTASLLNTFGVLQYLTPEAPFRKTQTGVDRGYPSVLQSMLERIVISNGIPLREEELSKLINVITCSVASRTGVKATTKEGILLRHTLALYAELDMLDYGISEYEPETEGETYFFNSKLHRYTNL